MGQCQLAGCDPLNEEFTLLHAWWDVKLQPIARSSHCFDARQAMSEGKSGPDETGYGPAL